FAAEAARDSVLARLHAVTSFGFIVTAIVGAGLCGLAGWMLARYAPAASGSGIPHIKGVLLRLRVLRWRTVLPVKFLGGVLCIGSGMSLGREGPTVQLGAAVGQAASEFLHVPRRSRKHLIACGAGAGLAAAFNAPLAGFIFVLEELQRELSPITYGTALIGALVADYVSRALQGQMPSMHGPGFPAIPLTALPIAALVGVLAGLLGVGFNRGLLASLRAFRRLEPWPAWTRTALAGGLAGLVVWWMPQAAGGGRAIGEALLRGDYSAPHFAAF